MLHKREKNYYFISNNFEKFNDITNVTTLKNTFEINENTT